jgi:EAL domain-containing protein (putative c-di-GMP-specific phosphodiesterase class I)
MHDHEVYLEITESVPLTHFELCMSVLREIRARGGVHLVVDDLGAGYSNLKRIADLEPSVVKLDRDLIMGIDKSHRQRQLVRSVVQLCTDLQARVVAEGIETRDEYLALRDTGVVFGQGYYFARPAFPLPVVRSLAPLDSAGERPSVPPV